MYSLMILLINKPKDSVKKKDKSTVCSIYLRYKSSNTIINLTFIL